MDPIRFQGAVVWAAFVATFLAVGAWESACPRTKLSVTAERRWRNHGVLLVLGAVSTAMLRVSPVALAVLVADSRFGLLNRPWMPLVVRCLAAILTLDLIHYGVHWTFHHVSVLWRVHEVHHSDPDYDVSTAARFHPLEVFCTQGTYLTFVALLAPPAIAVLIAVVLTTILNLLEHANAGLPPRVESVVRKVLVTPDMHRIHHSQDVREQSRNFGQTFSWWDRLFGTYLHLPAAGHGGMVTGVIGFQNSESLRVGFMLAEPFHARSERQKGPAGEPGPLI
jgi:sterol desaturase/sphingolipid hydroxylase (fatty acid hydroxylase superfamily)